MIGFLPLIILNLLILQFQIYHIYGVIFFLSNRMGLHTKPRLRKFDLITNAFILISSQLLS